MIGNMFWPLGSEFSVNVLSLYSSCCFTDSCTNVRQNTVKYMTYITCIDFFFSFGWIEQLYIVYVRRWHVALQTSADYVHLQEDINRISMWADSNYLQFNMQSNEKTDWNTATSIIPSWPATAGGGFLQVYLGVFLSSDLSWTRHIQSFCRKETNCSL